MQKMLTCTIILASCLSCVTKRQSEWSALDSLSGLDCKNWPKAPNEVLISEITPFSGGHSGFLVASLLNNSRDQYYYLPFKGDLALDLSERQSLIFNKNIQVLGAGSYKGQASAALLTQDQNGHAMIEWRNVLKNTVIDAFTIQPKEANSGVVTWQDSHVWGSFYDGQYRFALMDHQGNVLQQLALKDSTISEPKLLKPTSEHYYGMVKRHTTDDLASFGLIDVTVKRATEHVLPLKISGDVEGWDALLSPDGKLYIVYVAGDSMVGRAELVVDTLELSAEGAWTSSKQWRSDLDGSHIANPVLKFADGEFRVFATRWLDGESLLSIYRNDEGALLEERFGPLPEAASLVEVMEHEKDTFVLLRHKQSEFGEVRFEFCEL
jgi:hypothetical protein